MTLFLEIKAIVKWSKAMAKVKESDFKPKAKVMKIGHQESSKLRM